MTLIFDHRPELQGRPGLHALIAGVSAYPHLPEQGELDSPKCYGMYRLSSAALTAYTIYSWLIDHQENFPVPLATCRLLLSPSSEEARQINLTAPSCTLDNFRAAVQDWRKDASSNKENMTFFYFAGHGAQRTRDDAILLLEEFDATDDAPLRHAVSMYEIFYGLANSSTYPDMARKQLYFVDTCRERPSEFKRFEQMQTAPVFNIECNGLDKRQAPTLYAAAPGGRAFALEGEPTFFSQALLECLDGDAAERREVQDKESWLVSVSSLFKAIENALKNKLKQVENDLIREGFDLEDLGPILDGLGRDFTIHFLDHAPLVKIVLEVDPQDALGLVRIAATNSQGRLITTLPCPLRPHPYCCSWPADTYQISGRIVPPDPHYKNYEGWWEVKPPRSLRRVRVSHE